MNINLDDYSYSYANAVGNSLQQPLFKIVCNIAISASPKPWENQAWVVAKIAFHCFVGALCVIPFGLAWLAGKSISYLSKTQIDYDSLYLAPTKIEIPAEDSANASIDILTLSSMFSDLEIPNDRGEAQSSKQESLNRLCNYIIQENATIYEDNPQKRRLFCQQVSICLKGIIIKINSGKVSDDRKRVILLELAEASTRCFPTWLQVSQKFYDELYGKTQTVELKLLRLVQDYKELLILEFSQGEVGAQWHALSYIRKILGKDLGLNTDLGETDPYVQNQDPVFGKTLSKWMFLQMYENVNQLISAIQNIINSSEYDSAYYDFLVQTIRQRGVTNPEDYVVDHFFNDEYKINAKGVNLMLKCIGVLK